MNNIETLLIDIRNLLQQLVEQNKISDNTLTHPSFYNISVSTDDWCWMCSKDKRFVNGCIRTDCPSKCVQCVSTSQG